VADLEPPARDRGDIALYGLSALFAGVTAVTSTLVPHRFWGSLAFLWYFAATLFSVVRSTLSRRLWLTIGTWCAVALVPLLVEAVQRAGGRGDRAQEEVLVVEQAGVRLVHHGTPYLSRADIAALPADERLLAYTPYQPLMAVFGLPRAAFGAHWFTDARVWFALTAIGCFGLAYRTLGPVDRGVLRVLQMATVLPLCALTLATGGDDIPVLALTLLGFAYVARGRFTAAGIAVGLACALKLLVWPVGLVFLVYAVRRRSGRRFALLAAGLPLLTLLPALVLNADAFVENVVRYPGGHGLVASPAQSPLLGHVIAATLPAGPTIAQGLLVVAGLAIATGLLWRPPGDVAAVGLVSAVGLTAAIVLNPVTRFGYLLYPVAYVAVWWAARGGSRTQKV
jgi:hypothetical protein